MELVGGKCDQIFWFSVGFKVGKSVIKKCIFACLSKLKSRLEIFLTSFNCQTWEFLGPQAHLTNVG